MAGPDTRRPQAGPVWSVVLFVLIALPPAAFTSKNRANTKSTKVSGFILNETKRKFEFGSITFKDGVITSLVGLTPPRDGKDFPYIGPGLIDLQINVPNNPKSIEKVSRWLPSTGVTSVLPTLLSLDPKLLHADLDKMFPLAKALGWQIEGPLLSTKKPGAHENSLIEQAENNMLRDFIESRNIKMVTLDAVRGLGWIPKLKQKKIATAIGHTDADFDDFNQAVAAGAGFVTHLFNAMTPIRHREPGAAIGALINPDVTYSLIADGHHVHPAMLKLAWDAGVKDDRVVLITDTVTAAKAPGEKIILDGQELLFDGTVPKLADGTYAGSALTLDQAIRNMVNVFQVNKLNIAHLEDAWRAASTVAAKRIGVADRGVLLPGMRADILFLDRDLQVEKTIIAGEVAYQRK